MNPHQDPLPEALSTLVQETINCALACINDDGPFIPFIVTEHEIVNIVDDDVDVVTRNAQELVDKLMPQRSRSFAFAYDVALTIKQERADAIFIETAQYGGPLLCYAQRYVFDKETATARKIGNLTLLTSVTPRLRVSD